MSKITFDDWLLLRNLSQRTITDHLKHIGYLKRHIKTWNDDGCINFVLNLRKSGRKNATINHYITTIKHYYSYMSKDPPKLRYLVPDNDIKTTLTDDEIEKFINLTRSKGCTPKIWDTWSLFWSCVALSGCRIGEIANLTTQDIDFAKQVYIIRHTKTHTPRLVPIAPNLIVPLEKHMKSIKSTHLFITSKGRVFSDSSWLHDFHKRMKRLGIIKPNLSPYSFRHSMATKLLSEDIAISKVCKLLGNSIEQVSKTYEHLVVEDVANALKRHPLIRKYSEPEQLIQILKKTIEEFRLDTDNRFIYKLRETTESLEILLSIKRRPL